MKNWDLLQDQRKASNRVLDFAEIEQSLEWNGGWDRHISFEETRLCKAAVLAERAWLEWEKVIFLLVVPGDVRSTNLAASSSFLELNKLLLDNLHVVSEHSIAHFFFI